MRFLLAVAIVVKLALACHAQDGQVFVPVPKPAVKAEEKAKPWVRQRRVLFATAKWCGYCPQTEAEIRGYLGTSPVKWQIDETESANVQVVDWDERQDLVRRYKIGYPPTFVLIDGDRVVERANRFQMKAIMVKYAAGAK